MALGTIPGMFLRDICNDDEGLSLADWDLEVGRRACDVMEDVSADEIALRRNSLCCRGRQIFGSDAVEICVHCNDSVASLRSSVNLKLEFLGLWPLRVSFIPCEFNIHDDF